ncbi:hypothetical protein OS493_007603 [Desmophyllum pertusum]|uniref:Uncharacterized protein n=1 Tax=Desmophyllum pertusum TaxID=174260 RepID=A0A9W9YRJ1_9CNID|nr:hypothetical protein OS493_007603 [Desmophyllum pertusum]
MLTQICLLVDSGISFHSIESTVVVRFNNIIGDFTAALWRLVRNLLFRALCRFLNSVMELFHIPRNDTEGGIHGLFVAVPSHFSRRHGNSDLELDFLQPHF